MAQVGKAAVFSVTGGLAFSGSVTLAKTANKMVGASVTDEFEVSELKDGSGAIIGAASHGRRRKATFEIIPYDSSGVMSTARTNVKLPDPMATVTISDFNITLLDGTWNYVGGGSVAVTADGFIKVTLPCAQYGDTPAAFTAVT